MSRGTGQAVIRLKPSLSVRPPGQFFGGYAAAVRGPWRSEHSVWVEQPLLPTALTLDEGIHSANPTWGPFAYAMYLSIAVMRNGDRRLLRRGIAGTAEVLSAQATATIIREGESAWEARVCKYRLRVNVQGAEPGAEPYETDYSICAAGIRQGSVVNVAVSRHNRKRVTMDVGQRSKSGAGVLRLVPATA